MISFTGRIIGMRNVSERHRADEYCQPPDGHARYLPKKLFSYLLTGPGGLEFP